MYSCSYVTDNTRPDNLMHAAVVRWRGSATGIALDLRSVGRGFKINPTRGNVRNNLEQVVHTYVPLSPSSISW